MLELLVATQDGFGLVLYDPFPSKLEIHDNVYLYHDGRYIGRIVAYEKLEANNPNLWKTSFDDPELDEPVAAC